MDIVSTKEILLDAKKNKYAVPAFNIHNLETFQAVLDGAWEMKSPVIIATTPGTVEYAGLDYLVAIAKTGAKRYNIPVALHLDHCSNIDFLQECIIVGYKSVMIDASLKNYEDNIKITQEVVKFAKKYNVYVEAELGRVGGVEDDRTIDEKDAFLTDPAMALEFVKETGIDSLAVAIGTAHGVYEFEPELDFNRLARMNEIIDIPLALHGASGVSEKDIQKAIEFGICKINISTELKVPFSREIKKYFDENPKANDPRKYFTPAKEVVKNIVIDKIKICGSYNKV
ncbi:tagatose 6-phosphate aldolase 1, kbaY subunit [[Clostridium] ultunense Esp]|uniref:Tagatose 6-phosphate aldolase 1, kbaY subunit n=1 Tax=[Clostridium] ultunense Esp TaxID=1288971 RepID=M1ZKT9_9FIRM|nr:tagatose-bisphosphate aldolase subunit GatY [Schnuerera ultunensis]CCQ96032.1 tagatose 6-phosphate aldolase 1, kbaY subunit [[Clostridium] ultunense Esp]SHD76926.1 tagatose 6-phosphate aldolase 1, kbaY subunit [[Clostridium] ultunense Esp]